MTTVLLVISMLVHPAPPEPPVDCSTKFADGYREVWNPCRVPETIDEVCWSITNYWPFVEDPATGEWLHQAYGGQADSDPTVTATMYPVRAEDAGKIAATPTMLLGADLFVPGWGFVAAVDTFGLEVYQQGWFWHDYHGAWVIGIDIMTPEPLYYMVCDRMEIHSLYMPELPDEVEPLESSQTREIRCESVAAVMSSGYLPE